jgi:hypothetical protein
MPDLPLVATSDTSLASFIYGEKQRLVVVAPALRIAVANAIVRWRALGPTNVSVILDSAPDAIRWRITRKKTARRKQ